MRRFIAWLQKRFPEQLVVSKEEYKQLREELGAYNRLYQDVGQIVERLVSQEKRLQNLENAQGFIKTTTGSFKLER